VAVVRDEVLAKVADPGLRAYVVWTRILDEDDAAAARSAGAKLTDSRVVQLWDGGAELARALGRSLAIPAREREAGAHGFAWDVYLLYDRGARWGDAPPPPSFWMDQLRQVSPAQAPRLDGPALRARVEGALR
jgi:hypothetical protein